MRFANGDLVIARIGDKDQVGIIHKVSDLSTKDIPERTIFSVRFQSDVTRSHTFIHGPALTSNNTNIWTCPSSGKFEPLLKEVIRSGESLWSYQANSFGATEGSTVEA